MGIPVAALLLIGAGLGQAQGATTMLPVEHWSYVLIERLEAAGHLSGTADGIKPFSRRHMANLALRADSVAALTRIDRQRQALRLYSPPTVIR